MADLLYEFEWDSAKAQANVSKHGLDFELAATVFRDPLALTIPDEEHRETEARWIPAIPGRRGVRQDCWH